MQLRCSFVDITNARSRVELYADETYIHMYEYIYIYKYFITKKGRANNGYYTTATSYFRIFVCWRRNEERNQI